MTQTEQVRYASGVCDENEIEDSTWTSTVSLTTIHDVYSPSDITDTAKTCTKFSARELSTKFIDTQIISAVNEQSDIVHRSPV